MNQEEIDEMKRALHWYSLHPDLPYLPANFTPQPIAMDLSNWKPIEIPVRGTK
jgi:hypothetical protein